MKKIIVVVICLLGYAISNSQVLINRYNSPTISSKGMYGKLELDREIIIPELDRDKMLQKWKKEKRNLKSAESIPVSISPWKQGKWEIINDEFSVLRIKITGEKASSINVYFDSLFLSKSAELMLYDEFGKTVTGPITYTENLKNGKKYWGSNTFPGSSVIVELKVPTKEIPENKIHIGKVFYGIRNRGGETNLMDSTMGPGYGTSSACNVDVSCYNNWAPESKGIALVNDLTSSGTYTASLVMNTCNTRRPFILTAWHCVQDGAGGWIDPNESTFEFLWISPTCSPTSNTTSSILFNGATGRAKWQSTDFALLELNQNVPSISGLNFLGWSRSSTAPTSTTTIHHPRGDIMKIAIDNQTADIGNIFSTPVGWRSQWDIGTVNEGSSGAPIFDQNHKIVGQLYSNSQPYDPPCNQSSGGTNAGRFDLSWTGGGTNDTRLSNWLDPSNSNSMSTTTTAVLSLNQQYLSGTFLPISGPMVVCVASANYSITGIQPTASVAWSVSGPDANGYTLPLQNVCSFTTSGQQVTLNKVGDGTIKLFATITNCDGTVQYASGIVTFGVPTIYFNSGFWTNGYYQPIEGTTSFTDSRYPYITLESSYNNSYSWTLDAASANANYNLSFPPTFASIWFDTPLQPYDFIGFSIQTTNTCGTKTDPVYLYYDGPAEYYRVAPNPVASSVSIKPIKIKRLAKAPIKAELSLDFDRVQVFDKMGNLVLDKKYPANTSSSTIDVSMLKPDVYTLKIHRKDKVETHKIMVQR